MTFKQIDLIWLEQALLHLLSDRDKHPLFLAVPVVVATVNRTSRLCWYQPLNAKSQLGAIAAEHSNSPQLNILLHLPQFFT